MKFVGSKRRIVKEIAPIICKDTTTLYEPFCGGCNFTMYVTEHYPDIQIFAMDQHSELIAMWQAIQRGWNPPYDISIELYKDIKNNPQNYPKELVGYVGYGSFGAKFFGGYRRYGDGRNAYHEHFRDVTKNRMSNVMFFEMPYWYLDPRNVTIYCDPPYENSLGYGWIDYTNKIKETFNHTVFWDWVREQSQWNTVYVSEYFAPEDFECIWQKEIDQWIDKSKGYTRRTEKLWRYNGD